ncbi:MAG: ABC transporter substrate-binding protein [Acidimicrobiales bacterium]
MTDVDRPPHTPRRRLMGVVMVTAALLLAACGPPPSVGGGADAGRSATGSSVKKLPSCPLGALKKATGKVRVNLWYSGIVSPPVDVLKGLVKDFNASQDEVVVTANDQGTAYAEGLRKYEGASSKPKQLPQMLLVEDSSLGEMIDKGQILPVQSCMEADNFDETQILPAVRARFSADGVLYPAFFDVSTPIIYYNKVHFKKAGLDPEKAPRTLAEMAAFARKLKAAGVPKPISFLANDWFFNTWLAGIGQNVVNNSNGRTKPATKATFNTPEAQKALADLNKYNKEGLLNPFPVTDGSIDHYLALITEQSSMLIETSTASGTIAQALAGDLTGAQLAGANVDASLFDTKKVLPGSGPMPGLQAGGKVYPSGGAYYILNTSSPAQQAASWKFFKFMLKADNAQKWTQPGGYLPIVKSVVDGTALDDYFANKVDGVLLKPSADQLADADPDNAGPLIGPYSKYSDIVRGAMESVLFNKADPKAALTKAEADVNSLLKSYNGN